VTSPQRIKSIRRRWFDFKVGFSLPTNRSMTIYLPTVETSEIRSLIETINPDRKLASRVDSFNGSDTPALWLTAEFHRACYRQRLKSARGIDAVLPSYSKTVTFMLMHPNGNKVGGSEHSGVRGEIAAVSVAQLRQQRDAMDRCESGLCHRRTQQDFAMAMGTFRKLPPVAETKVLLRPSCHDWSDGLSWSVPG